MNHNSLHTYSSGSSSSFQAMPDNEKVDDASFPRCTADHPSLSSSRRNNKRQERRDEAESLASYMTPQEYRHFVQAYDALQEEIHDTLEAPGLVHYMPFLAFGLTIVAAVGLVVSGGLFSTFRFGGYGYAHHRTRLQSVLFRMVQFGPLLFVFSLVLRFVFRNHAHGKIRTLVRDFWREQAVRHGRIPPQMWHSYRYHSGMLPPDGASWMMGGLTSHHHAMTMHHHHHAMATHAPPPCHGSL